MWDVVLLMATSGVGSAFREGKLVTDLPGNDKGTRLPAPEPDDRPERGHLEV